MKTDDDILQILTYNNGFCNPNLWVRYARIHGFVRVNSTHLDCCPDCRYKGSVKIGQYIYYSTLISLLRCTKCKLVYSDTRLDPKIIKKHFESSYNNEEYFIFQRSLIFRQIANIVESKAGKERKILDIGGAKGHLLELVKKSRPDLVLTLNDLSANSCEWAKSNYQLDIINGGIEDIYRCGQSYDVVIMSDVIYYEPEITFLFSVLSRITNENGSIIMRIPNKYFMIKLKIAIFKYLKPQQKRELQTNITFFNPEHLYVFTRSYLSQRLTSIGYKDIKYLPSEVLKNNRWSWILYRISIVVYYLSIKTIILTPSMIVTAKKR